MLKPAGKIELNQISLTGVRSIVLIGLLIIEPRSLQEIKQAFLDFNLIDNKASDDIIRIDINTIKSIGCEIQRPCTQNNHKYVLTKHPFNIPAKSEHIKLLKKLYNRIKLSADIKKLLEYDVFFKKINNFISDENLKEEILGISILKYYDIELVKKLNYYCNKKYLVNLKYQNPSNTTESIKNISTIELIFRNDKIYLYGFDIDKKRLVTLNLNRIKSILSKQKNDNNPIPNGYIIKFKLLNNSNYQLENNEKIIANLSDCNIIEGVYYNEFYAMQRVLSLKEHCIVIEPENFKNIIISKLKEMRKIYGE